MKRSATSNTRKRDEPKRARAAIEVSLFSGKNMHYCEACPTNELLNVADAILL